MCLESNRRSTRSQSRSQLVPREEAASISPILQTGDRILFRGSSAPHGVNRQ